MTAIDWTIVVILLVSGAISIKRGFVKEALSLVTWIAALVIARLFADRLAVLLESLISNDTWRLAGAFAILFGATLIVGALINHLLAEFVRMTGLKGLDRILGMAFGVIRGLIIVVVILSIGRIFALEQIWGESQFVPYFEPIIKWTGQYVHQASSMIINAGQ